MATETRSAGTQANDAGTGTSPWQNVTNTASSNNVFSTVGGAPGAESNYHKSTNFSFATIGDSDTLTQIKIRVERKKSSGGNVRDNKLYLIIGGTIQTGTNYADTVTNYPSTDTYAEYTITTGLPTVAQLKNSGFGFAISCKDFSGFSWGVDYDHAEIVATYTPVLAITQVTEIDTAQALNPRKVILLGQASETDTAQTLTPLTNDPIVLTLPLLHMLMRPVAAQGLGRGFVLPTLAMPTRMVAGQSSGISKALALPTLKMPMGLPVPQAVFNITLPLPTLQMPMRSRAPLPVFNLTLTLPLLHMLMRLKPMVPAFSMTLNLPTLQMPCKSHAIYPRIITPSLAPYIESQRSSAAQVIYGSTGGVGGVDLPFKLNVTAGSYRRSGRVHIVHTGKVKPKVCTVEAQFTLATSFPRLAVGQFLHTRLDGYLTITNLDAVEDALVQDGDTFAISTAPADTPLEPMLITMEQASVLLE